MPVSNEASFGLDRLINYNHAYEGSILPPAVRNGFRVQQVKDFYIVFSENKIDGGRFILSWESPYAVGTARYHIYAYYRAENLKWSTTQNRMDIFPKESFSANFIADAAPLEVFIKTDQRTPVTFRIESRLNNGLMSDPIGQPFCSAVINPISSYTKTVTVSQAIGDLNLENIYVDCSSGAVTVTLPSIVSVPQGKTYSFKKVDGGVSPMTISAVVPELIDGAASYVTIVPNTTVTIAADKTAVAWRII